MEFWGFASKPSISSDRSFHLLQTPLSHMLNLLLPVGAFLTVYGFASTPSAAGRFFYSLLNDPAGIIWSVPIFRLLIVWGLFGAILGTIIRRRAGVTWGEYFKHKWLSGAINTTMAPYEVKSMASYFITGLRHVPVTPKSEKPLSATEVFGISSYSLGFQGVLWIGILSFNPLGAVFNATWLIPMALSPFILMAYGRYWKKTAADISTRGIRLSAVEPDPAGVHQILGAVVQAEPAAPPILAS
jgi:hypothetical protein